MANRSKAFGKQHQSALWAGRILVAVLVMAVWAFWSQVPASAAGWVFLIGGGVAAAAACGYFFKGEFEKQFRKQHRRVIVEQLRDGSTMPCELELQPGGIWIRQQGVEVTFPWSQSAGITDNGNDIEIVFSPLSLVVLRNRYFSSPAERQRFLDEARALVAR
jgi:hypothetical protein